MDYETYVTGYKEFDLDELAFNGLAVQGSKLVYNPAHDRNPPAKSWLGKLVEDVSQPVQRLKPAGAYERWKRSQR